MKPHPRTRRAVKWGGAAVTVLLVVVWVGSGWWRVAHYGNTGMTGVGAGVVAFVTWENLPKPWPVGWDVMRSSPSSEWLWWFYSETSARDTIWTIPLWVPAALCMLATVIAWRRDAQAHRRARVGLCPKCHYNRAGLAAGAVCPECGAAA